MSEMSCLFFSYQIYSVIVSSEEIKQHQSKYKSKGDIAKWSCDYMSIVGITRLNKDNFSKKEIWKAIIS
jgi:hypothetical protein